MKKIYRECVTCKESIIKNKGKNEWKKVHSFVVIDLENTNYTCGITGMVECANIVTKSKSQEVCCAVCNSILYKESERNKLLN